MQAYFNPTKKNMRERKMRSPDPPPSPNRVKPKTSSSTETISSIQPTSIQLSLSPAKADPSIAWARLSEGNRQMTKTNEDDQIQFSCSIGK